MSTALTNLNTALSSTIAELQSITESLIETFYTLSGSVDGAIADLGIALQQVIHSLLLAARTYPYVAYDGLGMTINMSVQDLASILAALIDNILRVTASLNDSDSNHEGACSLRSLLQSIISISELVTEMAKSVLRSIAYDGSLNRLDTFVKTLTDANDQTTESLLHDDVNSVALIDDGLLKLKENLSVISAENNYHVYGTVQVTASGMTDVLNRFVVAIVEVGGSADESLANALSSMQSKMLSLKNEISELFASTMWSLNSIDVSCINTLSAVEGIIDKLTDVAYGLTEDEDHVANGLNDQLTILGYTMNNLIFSVSRLVANVMSTLTHSPNVATELRKLAAIMYGVALKVQAFVGSAYLVLERLLDTTWSTTSLVWSADDSVDISTLLNALQCITGRNAAACDLKIPKGVFALLEVTSNTVSMPKMITESVYSIQQQIDGDNETNNEE